MPTTQAAFRLRQEAKMLEAQAGRMAQGVKCLPQKHEDRSLSLQNPLETRCSSTQPWAECSCGKMGGGEGRALGPGSLAFVTQNKTFALSLFSIVVIKHWPKPTWGREDFFGLHISIIIYRGGNQGRNSSKTLEAGIEAESARDATMSPVFQYF